MGTWLPGRPSGCGPSHEAQSIIGLYLHNFINQCHPNKLRVPGMGRTFQQDQGCGVGSAQENGTQTPGGLLQHPFPPWGGMALGPQPQGGAAALAKPDVQCPGESQLASAGFSRARQGGLQTGPAGHPGAALSLSEVLNHALAPGRPAGRRRPFNHRLPVASWLTIAPLHRALYNSRLLVIFMFTPWHDTGNTKFTSVTGLGARLGGVGDSHTAVQPAPPSSPGRSIFPQGHSVPVKPPLPPLPQPQPRRGLPVSAGLPPAGPACEWGLTGPSPCVWFTSLSTSSSLTHAAAGARASFPRLNDTP